MNRIQHAKFKTFLCCHLYQPGSKFVDKGTPVFLQLISKTMAVVLSYAMKRTAALFSLLLLIAVLSASAEAFDGPLQVKNQFPLFLNVNAPYLESASIEDSFTASLSHSSIYLVDSSSQWNMGLDMEITELNLRLRKSINNFIELGVEVPFLSFNSGFMDGFLSSYHDTFGFPDYGRSNRPDNDFLYEVKRNGAVVVKGESGRIALGDIRFTVKKPLIKGDPAISIKGEIEFPSGDPKTGCGNGSSDTGISLMMDKGFGEVWKTYLNLGAVFPGDMKGHERVNLDHFLYGGAAVEAAMWKTFSLLGQIFIQGSPFPETDIASIDRTAVLFSLGGRYRAGNSSFELSLTEDPNTSGAPDFTLNCTFKQSF
jgi:hypothetical protein